MPEPRNPKPDRAWIPAALLCVPPLVAWALIGLDASGLWRTVDAILAGVPPAVEAGTMLLSPVAAAALGGVAVVRALRAGEPLNRRLIALTITAIVLVTVTASAAWLGAT
ncbi:MAG: hypothetical protein OEY20_06795 [Gemmatimonadota bacterium]|nr:hypothetical protein [Gemmatimonadota bacterium]MDH4350035.1 hypothetical protein [Gemmatimonadota bacterium]MDH5196942.1 hypothetical protein [Gemmatimonadota bacterium]